MPNDQVMACVDHSSYAASVCDHAAWAALRLNAPLEFVHVLDRHPEVAVRHDYSGSIGLDAREQLLRELVDLDAQRSKIAQERGRLLLEESKRRAQRAGVASPTAKQRHGELSETLADLEPEVRLIVLGKRGEAADKAPQHLGRTLERVIRTLHRPILVVPVSFTAPRRILIAFDGSATIRTGIRLLAASLLFKDMACHIVMAGSTSPEREQQLQWARDTLQSAGHEASVCLIAGQPEDVLTDTMREHDCDLLVMGAYGHSRIRHLLVGSTTTAMIRALEKPMLLLR